MAVPSLLAAGIAAPAAMAADDCPNAAVRAQQQSQHLPNCMAYERVSPEDKNGAAPSVPVWLSTDGSRVAYAMSAGREDSQSFTFGDYRSSRGAEGWLTEALDPPFGDPPPVLDDDPEVSGVSGDLDRVLTRTAYAVNANDQGRIPLPRGAGSIGSRDLYIREDDGSFTWVVPDPSVPDTSQLNVDFNSVSPDVERVVMSTARPFDPRVTTTDVQHAYVWSRSGTHLATILPNGDLPTVLPVPSIPDPMSLQGTQKASADARRLVFAAGDEGIQRLYVRVNIDDPATAVTRAVDVGPNGEQCAGANGARLLGFSADGSKVLFVCETPLLPGAPALGVYLRDVDGGANALRLIGPGANATVRGGNADFSLIYLTGLDDEVTLLRDGVPETVVPFGIGGDLSGTDFATSPDGEYFVLQSSSDYGLPGVNLGPQPSNQVYRYSARTGEFRCVSCQLDGSPTTGVALLRPYVGFVVNNGRIQPNKVGNNGAVTFSATTGLDSADTNGLLDGYAWLDGRQVRLGGGRNADPSAAVGTTPDGTTFLFATANALVPDDRDAEAYDLYVARPDGGFLVPDAPSGECTSDCKAPAPERPSLPGLGSTDVLGRGNLVEETTTAKAPARASASLTVSRSVRGTNTKVRVKVSRAGSIRVSGVGLRQTTVKAKKAGTYRMTVRLSANGVKQQRSRGRLTTKVTARFTPQSGASVSARKSVTFTAKKGGR